MGEPITIKKKKKLTIKSKSAAAKPAEDAGTPAAPAAPDVVLPGITPPPAMAGAPAANYMPYAIIAFIVLSMFIGMLIIQWIEWTYLAPAFPHPLPIPGG